MLSSSFDFTDFRFSKNHLWIKEIENYSAIIGVTDFLTDLLGEIIFIDLPEKQWEFHIEEDLLILESASQLYKISTPLTCEIEDINYDVLDNPLVVNENPYEEGWLCVIDIKSRFEFEDLLTKEVYEEYLMGI